MKYFYHLLVFILLFGVKNANAQVLDPNDPVVTYNPASPPAYPAWGSIGKWVRTNRNLGWNTDQFKAYYYKGMAFRLKFPANYDPSGAKKYPLIVFFHGIGEKGTEFDNEFQLYHGAQKHMQMVNSGAYDGFLLYPQNQSGYFGTSYYDGIRELIHNFFASQINVDVNRITAEGLSGGGVSTWEFLLRFPKDVAAIGPISAAYSDLANSVETYKWTPIWWFQGASDPNPAPGIAQGVYNIASAAGANMKLSIYAGGHGIWGSAWNEADFFPFMSRAHKANPWPLSGRTEFCPGDPISLTVGLTAGFDGYEWRKDGDIIPGATSNTIQVTSTGTYDARIKRGTTWSVWSPIPVVVKLKGATVPPPITVSGLMSKVLPAPDGLNKVTLQVPAGYASYQWKRTNDPAIIGSANTYDATTPGTYTVKVTEQFGCSSDFSVPFEVINANGANKPEPASGLTVTDLSKTELQLNWTDKPNPQYNETGYEIYRASSAGGTYQLIAITAANAQTYTDNGLAANTSYYYIVRAVNNTAASASSNEASGKTQTDNIPPAAPGNLIVTGSTASQISIKWDAATDEVGVVKYDIYINGLKSYTVNGDVLSFTALNLVAGQSYSFTVKARDLAGNSSPASNQANGTAIVSGLNYKYYQGTWSTLPNFANQTIIKTGISGTTDISVANRADNFGFLWEGFIRIPVSGNYTFETYSDDGSKLYVNMTYGHTKTALVNNDGAHGAQYKEGTIYLAAGVYPIAATFFEAGGDATMKIFWKNTAHGVTAREEIPSSFLSPTAPPAGSNPPAAPTDVTAAAASYNSINVSWVDNSNNETGFEVYRSTSAAGTYTIIGATGANVTTLKDSALAPQTTYYYKVKAVNQNGNSGFHKLAGNSVFYSYYEASGTFGTFTTLPDFNALTPLKTGVLTTVNLSVTPRADNWAVRYEGYITVPANATYTFYTSSNDGSRLYIGGMAAANLVVENNGTRSSTVEKSGTKTLTAGTYPIYVTYFDNTGSSALTVSWQATSAGISKQQIPASAYVDNRNRATTLALPGAPAAPTTLAANALSGSKIQLTWNDNASNETAYQVYRSITDNSNFTLVATLAANATAQATYTDSALFANTRYYYKVRGKNEGGTSGYSNEINAVTLNTAPELAAISNRSMRYGTQLSIPVSATDADGEALVLSATNLPAFGALTDNGNGTGTLVFNPSNSDQGVYANIEIRAADGNSGVAVQTFNLTVSDNFVPVIAPITDVTVNENASQQFSITASDENATDVLTWDVTGLPAFATFTPNGNSASVQLNPTLLDAGTYTVTVNVSDGREGIDIKTFNIIVKDVNPNKMVYINFTDGSANAVGTGYWNNTSKQPALNDVFANLKDSTLATTPIALTILTRWQDLGNGSNNLGAVTNNNSGVYPDNVMRSAYWSGTQKQTIKISGLTYGSSFKYNFTFFGSRGSVSDNRTSIYTINGNSVSLNAANNTANTVRLLNVVPDANGEVLLDLTAGAGSAYSYLNAMVIEVAYDIQLPPSSPSELAAVVTNNNVKLTWKDVAFNETSYELYRGTSLEEPFTLLQTLGANVITYSDATVNAGTQYYYTLRAANAYGASAYTDTVSVLISNKNPVLAAIAPVSMKTDDVTNIALTASDDAGDVLTLTATGLPAFAVLTDNGNGTGTIALTPGSAHIGTYKDIVVKASDNKGGSTERTFTIVVKDKSVASIYVNFNNSSPAAAPWNNFNGFPHNNFGITNLVGEDGVATGITIRVIDQFTGENAAGAVTGNETGIYPDAVMRTAYYESSGLPRRIRISNLPVNRKYNLVFFGSRADVDGRYTDYSAGGQTVTLNTANNTQNSVRINGLSANASGELEFTVQRNGASLEAVINALVIQYYNETTTPIAPSTLKAFGKSKNQMTVTWDDNSMIETGYQVWRASAENGTYALVGTTAANAVTYQDNGLAANTSYYYKVRAITGTTQSPYSNVAQGATFAYSIFVNFNRDNPAPAPWNNANNVPVENATYNLVNDGGNNAGISYTIIQNFSGENPSGMVTGNNSGVYPDNVIRSSWWLDLGVKAKMRIQGLNQSQAYTFVFFGSRDGGGDRTTVYAVNGKFVTLNCSYNTSQTVQLENIVPDENGEVVIEVSLGNSSTFGYLGALVIHGYNATGTAPSGLDVIPPATQQFRAPGVQAVGRESGNTDKLATMEKADENKIELIAYPNPFMQYINLEVKANGTPKRLTARVFDMSGRLVQARVLGEFGQGTHKINLTQLETLKPGLYVISVTDDKNNGKSVKVIKH